MASVSWSALKSKSYFLWGSENRTLKEVFISWAWVKLQERFYLIRSEPKKNFVKFGTHRKQNTVPFNRSSFAWQVGGTNVVSVAPISIVWLRYRATVQAGEL